jgi:hypothetical protein
MRIRIAVPDRHISPAVLNAALEATTVANQEMLASGDAEPISEGIRMGQVKWKPEPFRDGEHFDLTKTVSERGWGDCDDLAPALAAELRESGKDPDARAIVKKSGPKRWHAVTELSDGRIVDPSAMAGMYDYKKKHGDSFVNGPGDYGITGSSVVGSLSTEGEVVVGVKQTSRGWAARCDLPVDGDVDGDGVDGDVDGYDIVGVGHHRSAVEAIHDAVNSALLVGVANGNVSQEDIARAFLIREALTGGDPQYVASVIGDVLGDGGDIVGFFGKILKGIKKVASPLANIALKAAKFVPIPGVSQAADLAQMGLKALNKGGGGGGGGRAAAVPVPGAPGLAAMMNQGPDVQMPKPGVVIVKF